MNDNTNKSDSNKSGQNPHAILNRKARFDYEILETFEAGLILVGSEVKSLRTGQASIAEAFVRITGEEAWLQGSFINPYEQAGVQFNHDPNRIRKILLHKREINRLMGKVKEKGLTIIPLKLYFNKRGFVKIEIGLAKGKSHHDKREKIRERDLNRQVSRDLRKYR
ncbi:MAG: SsrA-binding protein SmpB [Phycisphaerae bacterium]